MHLVVSLVSQLLNTVSTVESGADLLICLDEALELSRQVFVLTNQHVAVVLQGIYFCLNISILSLKWLVGETEITLLTARNI